MSWDWLDISKNPNVTKLPKSNIVQIIRRFTAVRKIQSAFLMAYYNPNYKICRNRLKREYNIMADEFDHNA